MFLFKCCSNHSLPNFLKSSKAQPAPIRSQVSNSSPNFQGRCSDEAVTGFGVQTRDILDASIEFIDRIKETASFEDFSCKSRRFSRSEERGKKIVIKSLKKPPIEVHTSSSNSIVVLVEDSKVKTKLLKHFPSLPCNSRVNSENKKRDVNPVSTVRSVSILTETLCSANEESFMLKAVSIDRAEFVFKRFSDKREVSVDNSQYEELVQHFRDCPKTCKVTSYSGSCVDNCISYDSASLNDNSSDDFVHNLYNSDGIKISPEKSAEHLEIRKKFHPESFHSINDDASTTDDQLVLHDHLLDNFGAKEESHDNLFSANQFIQSEVESQRALLKVSRKEIRVDALNSSPMNCKGVETQETNSKSMNRNRSLPVISPDYNESPIDILFAGESASYMEEFLPREGYLPIQFTILVEDELTSISSSEDSKNEISTSNDSLLSDRSSPRRPCKFNESRVVFSPSPDMEPSDDSIQNNSGNNSVTDSLLESPESPFGGLDCRHFYSKSLPNLDKQPYDGMSSLGFIEEYFSRYVVDSNENDDKGLGSRVDPTRDEVCVDSENCDTNHLEDQNRVHSLEKLTEICKRFSTTYLNFLQSHRSHSDLDSSCSTRIDQPSDDDKISSSGGPFIDNKVQEKDETPAFTTLYAAMFPSSDFKEISRVKNPPKNCDPGEPVSRKPSLVGRSVSMRECSINPGNKKAGKKKKAVKFADSFGFELAIVRLILSGENLSDQEFQQRFQATGTAQCNKSNDVVNNLDNISQSNNKTIENRKIVAEFVQPESSEEFKLRMEAQNVTLESCLPEEKSRSVSGCIRVKNLSYEKIVIVRYTLNDWLSYNETPASYISGSSDGYSDRFSFSIKLPSFFDVGSSIEFAILYRTNEGSVFWDNNCGTNYRMTCQKC